MYNWTTASLWNLPFLAPVQKISLKATPAFWHCAKNYRSSAIGMHHMQHHLPSVLLFALLPSSSLCTLHESPAVSSGLVSHSCRAGQAALWGHVPRWPSGSRSPAHTWHGTQADFPENTSQWSAFCFLLLWAIESCICYLWSILHCWLLLCK